MKKRIKDYQSKEVVSAQRLRGAAQILASELFDIDWMAIPVRDRERYFSLLTAVSVAVKGAKHKETSQEEARIQRRVARYANSLIGVYS